MEIFKLETVNGRVFKVLIENEEQKLRLTKQVQDNKGKYEEFKKVECITDNIHDIESFEKLANTLV